MGCAPEINILSSSFTEQLAWHSYRLAALSGKTQAEAETHLATLHALLQDNARRVDALIHELDTGNFYLSQIAFFDVNVTYARIPESEMSPGGRFAPFSQIFWSILIDVLTRLQVCDAALSKISSKCLQTLWLATEWAPPLVAGHIINTLSTLDEAILKAFTRLACLSGKYSTVDEYKTSLLGWGQGISENARSVVQGLAVELLTDHDIVDGENGGKSPHLVLERLRFRARVTRYRLGMEGMYNV